MQGGHRLSVDAYVYVGRVGREVGNPDLRLWGTLREGRGRKRKCHHQR
ncbi:MAG TPA: hypothetical protein VF558_02140 [Rubrobacteraceae bacterium]